MNNQLFIKSFFEKKKRYTKVGKPIIEKRNIEKPKNMFNEKSIKLEVSNDIVIDFLGNLLYCEPNNNGNSEMLELRKKYDSNSIILLANDMVCLDNFIEKFFEDFEYNGLKDTDVPLKMEEVDDKICFQCIDFFRAPTETKINKMKYFGKGYIYAKYKSGDNKLPSNFRYIHDHKPFLKLVDALTVDDMVKKMNKKLDPEIYIYKICENQNYRNLKEVATYNTNSMENVVLIDLTKAFDTINWKLIPTLLFKNLCKKMSEQEAYNYVNLFHIIYTRRQMLYDDKLVNIQRGLPTGLPSSSILFTLIMEEIIEGWLDKYGYRNSIDFTINIYVDDIYIKFISVDKAEQVISSLINEFQKYELIVNTKKSKYDKNLKIVSLESVLEETDKYLGIPFTRNIELYGRLMLEEITERHKVNNWEEINDMISEDILMRKKLMGYFQYKLYPFIDKIEDEKSSELIIKFIRENYMNYKYVRWMINFIIIYIILVILHSIIIL